MEAAYSLATLPKLFDTEHGQSFAAPVLELRGSRKRKRNEVVVGIDGDSLSIYNVDAQTQTLQNNYSLPPQAYQCCPPASVYSPASKASPAHRDTFSVIRNGPRDLSRRLIRYKEKILHTQEFAQPVKTEHKLRSGNVLGIEALPAVSQEEHASPRAVIIYEDGTILCVDGDMTTTSTQSVLQSDESSGVLEYVEFVDMEAARKTLLQGRDDLLAVLPTTSTLLGCFLIRNEQTLSLRISSLDTVQRRFSLRNIDNQILPFTGSASPRSWSFKASTGQLFSLADGAITIFNLTGLIPQIGVTIKDQRAQISAFTVVSPSAIVALAERRLTIYDSKYGSDQGSIVVDDNDAIVGSGKKRKRTPDDRVVRKPSLCFFPGVNTVLLTSRHILGIQLKDKPKSSRLSNVLGKGTSKYVVSMQDSIAPQDRDWYTLVDGYVGEGDVESLEAAIIKTFNLLQASDAEPWSFEDRSTDLDSSRYRKALVVLERLFQPVQSTLSAPAKLHLRLISSNIIRWLVVTGLLTAEKLTAVLSTPVTNAQIANALADPSFEILQDVLSLEVRLPASFIVECLRLLIRSLDVPSIEASEAEEFDIDTPEYQLERESRTAEKELSNALTALETGLESRSEAMRLVLDHLITISSHKTLVKEMGEGLAQQDLFFFIHLLRMELAGAGWTGRYVDDLSDHDDEEPVPKNHAISTIGNLLLAAVDAIGTTGWLVGISNDDNDNLIEALRAEIAASVEGAFEAHSLHAYLNEMERFAAVRPSEPNPSSQTKRDRIEVLSTAPTADDTMMPLGGRSSIINTKGERKARDIGGMIGVYQLERIGV